MIKQKIKGGKMKGYKSKGDKITSKSTCKSRIKIKGKADKIKGDEITNKSTCQIRSKELGCIESKSRSKTTLSGSLQRAPNHRQDHQ